MDVRCSRCGEPWDLDTLHDEVHARRPDLDYNRRGRPGYASAEEYAEQYPAAYDAVREDFTRRGCAALTRSQGSADCEPSPRGQTAAMVYDLLGDDFDGAAAMLEDAEAWGL